MGRFAASPANRVCQRVAAAVLGGYVLAALVSSCLSLVLPVVRSDAVLTGLLASFLVYAAAILWVFAVPSLRRVWWGLGGAIAVLGLGFVLMAPAGIP